MTAEESVRLRPVEAGDLPRLYDMQLDAESNRMAVAIPRTREAFDALWAKSLDDPSNTTRAILVGGEFVGYVSCFPLGGEDHVGYWIDRAFWGQGIASLALRLLIAQNRLLKTLGYETVRYLEDAPEYAGASSAAAVAS